jgi:hypothetical protein
MVGIYTMIDYLLMAHFLFVTLTTLFPECGLLLALSFDLLSKHTYQKKRKNYMIHYL